MALSIFAAAAGGLIPSLIWLAFWLSEARCEPEPRVRIIITFFMGMLVVALVYQLEVVSQYIVSGAALLVLWASIEEILKLAAASVFGLMGHDYDEPLDAVVYMATAALGFAAAENALYLFAGGHMGSVQNLLTGDLRFVGATLLHVLSSTTIGLIMAFFYYFHRTVRTMAVVFGVILAIALHTLFNFFILSEGGTKVLFVFAPIWLGIIVILVLVERIKNPKRDYC